MAGSKVITEVVDLILVGSRSAKILAGNQSCSALARCLSPFNSFPLSFQDYSGRYPDCHHGRDYCRDTVLENGWLLRI
jgi:hypothetical protein